MGSIPGLFGTAGGVNGTGLPAPALANITPGTNAGQISTAYGGAQNSLQSQQALLQALQAQQGLQNQSNVYGQLQNVAAGQGPNPAQAMLQQATGQNVANQAALMAGQRGAGSNVGLMARQAAQQGAQTQQNAVGQAANLQAQQSLGALGQAGQMANTMAGNQIGATTANTQAAQNEQQLLQTANAQANNANVASQGNVNSVYGQLANTTMQGQQGLLGGAMQGIGQAMSLAEGGTVQKFADGGSPNLGIAGLDPVPNSPYNLGVDTQLPTAANLTGPQSSLGQFLQPQQASPVQAPSASVPSFGGNGGAQSLQQGMAGLIGSGGKSSQDLMKTGSSMISGGGGSGMLGLLAAAAEGGTVGNQLKSGGHVPGKAKVKGNSYQNDNVKALLSPGEGVIDRETMNDQGPMGQSARALMAAIAAKKGGKQ